jgi:hypothetical protein
MALLGGKLLASATACTGSPRDVVADEQVRSMADLQVDPSGRRKNCSGKPHGMLTVTGISRVCPRFSIGTPLPSVAPEKIVLPDTSRRCS